MRIVFGILMLLVGLIGWILPVIPGWPFIIAGLVILSTKFTWAQKLLERLRAAGRGLTKPPSNPSEKTKREERNSSTPH